MKYPKIETLFNRKTEGKKKGHVIEGEYRLPEFENIKKWRVTEKIDGTNTRVFFKDGEVRYGGRTDNAQLHVKLIEHLQNTFTHQSLDHAFPMNEDGFYPTVTLFGEGYGPKIQKGGNYRPDISFRLFDVYIKDQDNLLGGWWLEPDDIYDIAQKLGIQEAPNLGTMTTKEIIDTVKNGIYSLISLEEGGSEKYLMEGLVARTCPLMFTRRGSRVMFKLKTRDFAV